MKLVLRQTLNSLPIAATALQILSTMDTASPLIIHIEGNIGAGKTSLLNNLLRHYTADYNSGCILQQQQQNDKDFFIIKPEPLKEWTSFAGENLLATFYTDPARWGFTFNVHVYNTLIARRESAFLYHQQPQMTMTSANNNNNHHFIFERSIESTTNVFVPYAFQTKNMSASEFAIFKQFASNCRYSSFTENDHTIYLSVPPSLCHQRLIRRDSEEKLSSDCTIEWLTTLEKLHTEWFSKKAHVYYIDGVQSETDVLKQCLDCINDIVLHRKKHKQQ